MIYGFHEWKAIESAPSGVDLELAVLEAFEITALVFPRRWEQGFGLPQRLD
ncbi:hypothetical protein [Mesorhizobium sp.]|uniref:hypothetical protein n=1 Tax=Mesorhizobium sp. TaxID=1871066 RepID=UPI0025FA4862|nr:hypothetical protein [Mesorhizobium sp.]